ncbi:MULTISPECIES: YaaA family protein [unclassified Knoellia]|uniref:YaaA family protein n=1 Tax=Knoellia altitudinis TaxID=3404795 RepID=UPI0036135C96
MLIVLPPSESKSNRRRGKPVDPSTWSFPALAETRETVATHLRLVSESPTATADLGVSPGLSGEVARNLSLYTAPATPAAEVYTGVLYDALGLDSMPPSARRRANQWVVIVSALHGAVRLKDRITAYRLSMDVNLPGLGPVSSAWRPVLDDVLAPAAGREVVVDCRSSTYAAAWTPRGDVADRWVQVRVPGASHMAKHTRGLVARHLCVSGQRARTPEGLAAIVGVAFDVELTPPARPGKPAILDVLPR